MLKTVIKPQAFAKYLGIEIDNKLNFNRHTKIIKKKIITRVRHFRALTYNREGINLKTATNIYKMICRPMLDYGHTLLLNCRLPALRNIETAERQSL